IGCQRFRLADRSEALVKHFVALAKADVAVPKRRWVDGPSTTFLGDRALLPEPPSAVIFSALKQQHRQAAPADDCRRVGIVERGLERRQGGERTSCWRGGNLLALGPFVIAIVVSVIAITIMIRDILHVCLPPWKASSASENVRAVSTRPGT